MQDSLAQIGRPHDSPRIQNSPAGFLESWRGIARGTLYMRARLRLNSTQRGGRQRDCPHSAHPPFLVIFEFLEKGLILLAPRAGFEPATIRLTVECSTAELPRNERNLRFATGSV